MKMRAISMREMLKLLGRMAPRKLWLVAPRWQRSRC